jgi:Family of unknown function (DUF6644)
LRALVRKVLCWLAQNLWKTPGMLLIENPLDQSPMIFPVLECIHILGFAVLVGTIAMVDFRILGLGLRRTTAGEINRDLAPLTMTGLVMMLLSGPLLFLSDPDMYYLNHAFQLKMVLLVLAIAFHYTIHRKAVQSGQQSMHKLVAFISLGLWTGVIAGGLFIAFV